MPILPGFAAAAVGGDDLHAEPDQRAHVGSGEAVGADDLDRAPAGRQRDADLGDARVAGAGGGVDLLAERDLVGEGDGAERIVGAVHRLVGARRRRRRSALGRVEQLERRGGAVDRRGADLIGMGEGGGLAADAAQAEARAGAVVGGLQPAVVEAERLVGAIFEEQLTVVASGEVAGGEALRAVAVEHSGPVEELARVVAHRAPRVRGPAFEDEAAVAIAAFDEADVGIDAQEHARMAKLGRDRAGAVAGDLKLV